ncbi:hypothetical protein PR202_ga03664 [Eleusine coracana subsp. coracana]|uniref:F-box domain-containing protein n=1 Tax=Eleusine coracana subsp. coracana TaxID=191504 RepID=A0AAV5BNY4_ELECO|nr:hypothetical protein PR202_ga03664 [Eleusine coracana subsp. coracana]
MSQMEKAAPPNPCSAPTGSRFGPPLSDGGELPFDLMLDVLLRVPGKDLCRLRAVCRRWRAATTDSVFVREHAARHGVQIFLANLRNDDAHVHVVDISGAVVKRINVSAAHRLLCTRLDLACVTNGQNSCCVLDPATGAVVPGPPVPWQGRVRHLTEHRTSFTLGKVAATGEYKVLRMFSIGHQIEHQLFEVFTIGGTANNARWRRLQSPNLKIEPRSAVVIQGWLEGCGFAYLEEGSVAGAFCVRCLEVVC